MQKKVIIFIWILILSSCSVSRYGKQEKGIDSFKYSGTIKNRDVIERNLGTNSFFIQKAEIETISGNVKQKFLASVKYILPDSFLISIRSNAGIEAARIFLTDDTLMINDRINKTTYAGSSSAISKKYGITRKLLPLSWGDFVINKKNSDSEIRCSKEIGEVNEVIDGLKIVYKVNCKKAKVVAVSLTGGNRSGTANLIFKDFILNETNYIGREVNIEGFENYDLIRIKYSKIEAPWHGVIEFIPGRNYEMVEIK